MRKASRDAAGFFLFILASGCASEGPRQGGTDHHPMKHLIFGALFLLSACAAPVPEADGPRVVLVTLDGVRWEEVFTGVDSSLALDEQWTDNSHELMEEFWRDDPEARRQTLMPFLWSVVAENGAILGNRNMQSDGVVTNGLNFSYPSYSEILTGEVDEGVNSNDKIPNPNVTVLEWVSKQTGFENRVAAFGSWDVFPYIINEERSGVPVNGGFESAEGDLSDREVLLNEMQRQTPSPWSTVRLDVYTHHFALEYMKRRRPRLTYVAYGESDDFAHDRNFSAYIRAIRNADRLIEGLWAWIQSQPDYRDKTTLIITTDHGRGSGPGWIGHGAGEPWAGSGFVWLAAMGPTIEPVGEVGGEGFYLTQVAATVAAAIDLDYEDVPGVGRRIEHILR